MFVIRDLVVDMSNFYAQYKSIKPYLQKKDGIKCVPGLLSMSGICWVHATSQGFNPGQTCNMKDW